MNPILAAVGIAACLALAPSGAAAAPPVPFAHKQAPAFFRWTLGTFEVTAINDGAGPLAMDDLLHGVPKGAVRAAYERDFMRLPVAISRNAFLINTGTRLVLIDTGGGDDFDLHEGRVRDNLPATGYRADQIDIVLLTHLHPDHIGGLLIDGRAAFPNAVVRLDKREFDYWTDPANEAKAPAEAKAGFRTARAAFAPYIAAGRVSTFDGPSEIVPGIRAVPAYGHTPGHTFYAVESGDQKLMLWGDVVHAASVQFADPSVTIAFDSDEPKARSTRAAAFRDAAAGGYWVAGAHLPFPGTGHLRVEGKGYVFVPANWSLNRP